MGEKGRFPMKLPLLLPLALASLALFPSCASMDADPGEGAGKDVAVEEPAQEKETSAVYLPHIGF